MVKPARGKAATQCCESVLGRGPRTLPSPRGEKHTRLHPGSSAYECRVCTQPTRKRGCPLDGLYRADTTSRRASNTHDTRAEEGPSVPYSMCGSPRLGPHECASGVAARGLYYCATVPEQDPESSAALAGPEEPDKAPWWTTRWENLVFPHRIK